MHRPLCHWSLGYLSNVLPSLRYNETLQPDPTAVLQLQAVGAPRDCSLASAWQDIHLSCIATSNAAMMQLLAIGLVACYCCIAAIAHLADMSKFKICYHAFCDLAAEQS